MNVFNSIRICKDLKPHFRKKPISLIWNQDRSQFLEVFLLVVVGGGSIFTKSDRLSSCCHSGADKCFCRNSENVGEHKVSSKTAHCKRQRRRVECYCGQDDWADKRVGEEANRVAEWRGHRIVETEQTRELVKSDCSNLAGEDVDEVLDDSAVVAAARRGGAGQDLDQGGRGGWRGGAGAGGGGGVLQGGEEGGGQQEA